MTNRAVCIGINDYEETNSSLKGCVPDAQAWSTVLSSRGFAIVQILDSEATKEKICETLESTIGLAESGEAVVITFSGHGSWQPDNNDDEPDEKDEGWCPYDVKSNGLLLDDELYEIFGLVNAGVRLVMISDSCHSGTMAKMPSDEMLDGGTDGIRFMPPSRFLSPDDIAIAELIRRSGPQVRTKPDRALLMSGCLDHEFSFDSTFGGRPHGAFTYYAIKALKALSQDATYKEWLKEIRRYLPNSSHPQTPDIMGNSSQRLWEILQ